MDMNDLFGDYQNGNYSAPKITPGMQENNFNNASNGGNQKTQKVKAPKAKKKGGFGVILVLILIIAIAGGGYYAYAYTDLFKTPKQLMAKYAVNLFEVANSTTPISAKIAEKNTGTSSVDGKLTIPEVATVDVDLLANYDEKISELTIGTKIAEQDIDLKVVANDNQIGIASGLLDVASSYEGKEFIGVKNENLKTLVKKFEVDVEILKYIPDTINFDGFNNLFTEAELEDIKTRYFEILNSKLTDDMFSVQDKVNVEINGTTYQTKQIVCNVDEKVLLDIIYAAISELRYDEVILNCYKKVADIELPGDKVEKVFDDMIKSLDEAKLSLESETENIDTISISLYAYKGKTIRVEAKMISNEPAEMEEISYSLIETNKGYLCISETYTPKDGYVPALTQTTKMDIQSGPTSQVVKVDMETKYDQETANQTEEDTDDLFSSSFMTYEDSLQSYVYEIKDYSDSGYSDSLTVSQEGNDVLTFTSKVKFDGKVNITKLSDSNTVYINDLESTEMSMLLFSAMSSFSGGLTPDMDDTDSSDDLFYSEEVTEDDTDDLYSNTITEDIYSDYEVENTVLPDVVEPENIEETKKEDARNKLSDELKAAITTCETEAKKTEYILADYVIVENLKNLCSSIDTIEVLESEEFKKSFKIVDLDGYEYEYYVFIDEANTDDSYADSLSQF